MAKTDVVPNGDVIRLAANDKELSKQRYQLAKFASREFASVGSEMHLLGHVVGKDRLDGSSPFGHGDDETVAISVLLRIAAELLSSSSDLFEDDRKYAAAALLRQMVEVEYLAWAMDSRDRDGERWLRSTREERESFFTPSKLRKASQGKFRGKDYGYHCELGGHPVPGADILFQGNSTVAQMLLVDLLGHAGRIWDHLLGWARKNSNGMPILSRAQVMSRRFNEWKSADPLTELPPPN